MFRPCGIFWFSSLRSKK